MKGKTHRIHIRKKAFVVLLGAIIVAIILALVVFMSTRGRTIEITGSTTTFFIDDEEFRFTKEPFICDNEIYLPVEDILPLCGYTLGWDESKGAVTATIDKDTTYIYKDKNILERKGKVTEYSLPVMKRGGLMYIPSQMFEHFSRDELVFDGAFKFVERPYRDLMESTYIDDTHRLSGDVKNYNGVSVVDNKYAMEVLYYPEENCINYAKVINSLADALPSVQVYDVAIPSMTEFYGPEELYTDQISGIRTIYANLNENVMPVNVIKEMWPHADEHLYFSTDHHWTQRGAYYAYRAFIHAKGEDVPELSEFPTDNVDNFIGSWKHSLVGTEGENALNNNPETLERFLPVVNYTGKVYLDMHLTEEWRDSEIIEKSDHQYTTFIGGDMPIIKYTTDVKNGEKAVIIKESFGNAFATWAINNYEEVYIIDPRSWNGFNSNANHGEFNLVKFYNEVCQFNDLIVVSYPGSAGSGMRNAISALIKPTE